MASLHSLTPRTTLAAALLVTLSACMQPKWVRTSELPEGYTRKFYSGQAADPRSPENARSAAITEALLSAAGLHGGELTGAREFRQRVEESSKGIRSLNEITRRLNLEFKGSVTGFQIEESWTERNHDTTRVWILLSTERLADRRSPPSMMRFGLASAVPGLGQFIKKESTKGSFFLVSTVGTAALGYDFDRRMRDALRSEVATNSQQRNDALHDRANLMYGLRNASFVVSGILWLANVADAATSHANYFAFSAHPGTRNGVASASVSVTLPLNARRTDTRAK